MRPFVFLAAAVLFALFLMNLSSVVFMSVNGAEHKVNFAEFVTILLTVVTIVLAALGIGVAVLAIWGYQTISKNTKEAADKKAGEVAESKIISHLNGGVVRASVARVDRKGPN